MVAARAWRGGKASAGTTLLELLCALCVVGILAALAVPSLGSLVLQYRAQGLAQAFVNSVQLARSEAIHRNARVLLCKSLDGVACAATGGYEQGWLVFQDANGNGALEAGEAVIQVQGMPPGPLRLYGNGPVANYISFNGMGLPKMLTGEFQAGTLILCGRQSGQVSTRHIVLSKPGNVRTERTDLAQCG